MVVIVLGVSGAGKTEIGQRLASALHWPFYDADDFHPLENIEKMRQGTPLTDADRHIWLETLGQLIDDLNTTGQSAVMACSALKQSYRDRLRHHDPSLQFVYLKGSYELIYQRLARRKNHFMKANLLMSQFETLEEPVDAIAIAIDQSPEQIVEQIWQNLAPALPKSQTFE